MVAPPRRPLDPATATAPASSNGDSARTVTPRRGLPGSRPVVGGLLVAAALVGIFAAVSGAGKGPTTRYVVAARDLRIGQVLGSDDLRTVAADLPADVARGAFRDVSALEGAVTLAPVQSGGLVQAGSIGTVGRDAQPTVELDLPAAAAVSGELVAGDRVEVYATYGDNESATTRRLMSDARVLRISEASEALSPSSSGTKVVLAVPDAKIRLQVVNAIKAGTIVLARVTGTRPGPQGASYPEPTTTAPSSSRSRSGSGG
ncbi:MAG: hypothetical protein HYX34_03260 [Actinobacteria bacterium]|nr:hypothetical protein [Actinomycetota bacterium]